MSTRPRRTAWITNEPSSQCEQNGIDPAPGVRYQSLAADHIALAPSDESCCEGGDVLESPDTTVVRVVFGADLPGLTFLADVPDELVNVGGGGVVDLLLADLDKDDRNDLVALRADHQVAIAMGQAGPPYFDAQGLDVVATNASGTRMALGDLDCDGRLDLAITDPDDDGFVTLSGNGDGTFDAPDAWTSGGMSQPRSLAPQDIATGDLDGDDDPDVVVTTIEAGFTVLLNECPMGFASPVTYPTIETIDLMTEAPLVLGRVCPGHPEALAVVVGFGFEVFAMCNDGTGNFVDVVEPHEAGPEEGMDYYWDVDSYGGFQKIRDLWIWEADHALLALHNVGNASSAVSWLPANPAQYNSSSIVEPIKLYSGGVFHEMAIGASMQMDEEWARIAFVGEPGLGVLK